MKPIELGRTEAVLAVVPEVVYGPGWANRVVWVHITDCATGAARVVCLQPDELGTELHTLFLIGATVCEQLRKSVATTKTVNNVENLS